MSKQFRSKAPVSSTAAQTGSTFRSRPFSDDALTKQSRRSNPSDGRAGALRSTQSFGQQFNGGASPMFVQAKLQLGPANDPYEQQADRVAAHVASRSSGPFDTRSRPFPKPQILSEAVGIAGIPLEVESAIEEARGGGQSLPLSIRAPMESGFGADFSGVRVHADAHSDQLSQAMHARAFTAGQDIFFAHGEYVCGSTDGLGLLAHELTHVVQQDGKGRTVRRAPSKSQLRKSIDVLGRIVDYMGASSVRQKVKVEDGPAYTDYLATLKDLLNDATKAYGDSDLDATEKAIKSTKWYYEQLKGITNTNPVAQWEKEATEKKDEVNRKEQEEADRKGKEQLKAERTAENVRNREANANTPDARLEDQGPGDASLLVYQMINARQISRGRILDAYRAEVDRGRNSFSIKVEVVGMTRHVLHAHIATGNFQVSTNGSNPVHLKKTTGYSWEIDTNSYSLAGGAASSLVPEPGVIRQYVQENEIREAPGH